MMKIIKLKKTQPVLLKCFPQVKEYVFVKATFKWKHFKVLNVGGNFISTVNYETWIMNHDKFMSFMS